MNKIVIQKSQYNDLDNTINISEQNVNNDVSNSINKSGLTAMIKTKMCLLYDYTVLCIHI